MSDKVKCFNHTFVFMDYLKITFSITGVQQAEELTAYLTAIDFEAFEETATQLIAYIPAAQFEEENLKSLSKLLQLPYEQELLPSQNWNETWERNFEPVMIDEFCSIRADFHPKPASVEYDIVITPKMSFGTGHHATTALMVRMMRNLDFTGKRVLDYGTGTGILAILAEKMGADSVLAIDNDQWSVENSLENGEHNEVSRVKVQLSTLEQLTESTDYDILLANINRNILIASMSQLYSLSAPASHLLLSGILEEDVAVIKKSAETEGFKWKQMQTASGWVALLFERP